MEIENIWINIYDFLQLFKSLKKTIIFLNTNDNNMVLSLLWFYTYLKVKYLTNKIQSWGKQKYTIVQF